MISSVRITGRSAYNVPGLALIWKIASDIILDPTVRPICGWPQQKIWIMDDKYRLFVPLLFKNHWSALNFFLSSRENGRIT